jgi:hypothetical protein
MLTSHYPGPSTKVDSLRASFVIDDSNVGYDAVHGRDRAPELGRIGRDSVERCEFESSSDAARLFLTLAIRGSRPTRFPDVNNR